MKDYMLLFRGGLDFATAAPEQVQQAMMKWKTWMEELTKAGYYNHGERLTRTGQLIKGNGKQVSDGPYTEGKEVVGGYISIKASDLQKATEIAMDCPILITMAV